MRTGGGLAEDERLRWENGRRKLADLRPQEDNPRHIDKDSVERLRTSWDDYGQVDPLAVGPDGSIYNGHQRYYVLLDRHGPDYAVDVRVASRPLTRREWQRLTVLLHEGAVGEWDFDGLANWDGVDVGDLVEWGFDPASLGIEDWDKEEPPADPGAQIDKAAELQQKWGTALGQLWEVGRHRIVCGDCTDAAVVEKLMQGEKAGAVVTDPPYGVTNEDWDRPFVQSDLDMLLANSIGGVVCFNAAKPDILHSMLSLDPMPERVAVWRYSSIMPRPGMIWSWQPVFYWRCSDIVAWDSLDWYQGNADKDGTHPTQKSVEMFAKIIAAMSGDILDPFLGSGTTLVACEQLGRIGRGIDIEPKYVAVSLERLAGMGLEPKLIGTI